MTKRGRNWRVARTAKQPKVRTPVEPSATIHDLPPEILTEMFLYLDGKGYFACMAACRLFREIGTKNLDRYMESMPLQTDKRFELSKREYRYISWRILNTYKRFSIPPLHRLYWMNGLQFDWMAVDARWSTIAQFYFGYYKNPGMRSQEAKFKIGTFAGDETHLDLTVECYRASSTGCKFHVLEIEDGVIEWRDDLLLFLPFCGIEMMHGLSMRFRQFFEAVVWTIERIQGARPAWADDWKWPMTPRGFPRRYTWIETGMRFVVFCHAADSPVRKLLDPHARPPRFAIDPEL